MSLFGKVTQEAPLIAAPIEDYALIGDTETAALVCKDGSLDWLCWPAFSSGAVFAGLLGTRDNGYYKIHPAADEAIVADSWRYLPHTLIVEKTWTTLDGEATVTDFMPPRGKNSDVVRMVHGVRGTVKMRMDMTLRFDYGCTIPWVSHVDHHMRAIAGPHLVVLRTDAPLRGEDLKTVSDFTVHEGETICFVLSYGSSMAEDPESFDACDALRETEAFWTQWVAKGTFDGNAKWHDAVERSLITLKALTYKPSGGLVAAPTTSLPEQIGGKRNWDYRYCWLRDTSWTLLTLLYAGYTEEALAWRGWLLRAASGAPHQLRAVYGLNGERLLNEWPVDWLPGYENSKPVNVGNGASDQLQLDIFGEVITALTRTPVNDDDMWGDSVRQLASGLLDYLATIWREPDNGVWEVRGGRKHFTHSKLEVWLAFDRAIHSYDEQPQKHTPEQSARVDRWRIERDAVREELLEKGFDKKLNSFVQSYGSKAIDASSLRIPLVGFLPGDDPRVLGTIRAVEERLMPDGLVLRYDTEGGSDGLAGSEGAFLACSFWYTSCLHLAGRREEACVYFERLLGLRNDLGLLSEEYDPKAQRMLGNFPQALSHIALSHAAIILNDGNGPWNGKPIAHEAETEEA